MTLTLEGDTLGKKHEHYNKLVQEAVTNENYELNQITYEDSDLDNLFKIDIACKIRNVDYIIEVLKSNDMLYVTRAIKKSPWLITDPQYAHIINPEYLHSQLFPSMHTNAISKLMLNIRLKLKDTRRVEAFYNYFKGSKEAYKWLQNCSLSFIEDVIQSNRDIPLGVFKRLCRMSSSFITYHQHVEEGYDRDCAIDECMFLLKSHTTEYLDEIEKFVQPTHWYNTRRYFFQRRRTEILMKKCKQRILNKFDFYVSCVDLSVLTKHLEKSGIKAFLKEQSKNDRVRTQMTYKNLQYFINNIPKDERYQFIKLTFIDKAHEQPNQQTKCDVTDDETISFSCNVEWYHWLIYAPFNEAFKSLVKLLRAESSPSKRCKLLFILIQCAKNNPHDVKSLLDYYYKKHINEPINFKMDFINNALEQIPTYNLNDEGWQILNQIFHSMEVYRETETYLQTYFKVIIIHTVIRDAKVPEIVEKNMWFDTFSDSRGKLNEEHKEKLFSYLLNLVFGQIRNQTIESENDLYNMVRHIEKALALIKVWKRDICDYPFILDHIKNVANVKKDKLWDTDLSVLLYNIQKSWRRYMFDNTFTFLLNEEVCLNALKHNPQLLARYDKELEALRTNDKARLRRLLAKIRVYWPQSLAQQWTDAYLLNLNKAKGQKAAIKGLLMLMTQKQVIDMVEKHKPEDFKIKWGEINLTEINLRKYIAQHLHLARPFVPLETVLWYAEQDYLQYAVPSIYPMMSRMSKDLSRKCLVTLLEAPVSLQKFGIRFAFLKLQSDELVPIYSKIWLSTKNLTIRQMLFTRTFNVLCKTKNKTVKRELRELVSKFIDNLSSDDNKEIFHKLTRLKDLPFDIQPYFFIKSYNFLTSLAEKDKGQMYVDRLLENAPKIIASLDEDFVVERILSPIETKILSTKNDCSIAIKLMAIFVLASKNEEDQLRRYRRVLLPTMKLVFEAWDSSNDYEYKNKFKDLIKSLIWYFIELVSYNKITPPAQLFTEIQKLMEENLIIPKNYILYTSWKLITEYVKLMDENKSLLSVFETDANSKDGINIDFSLSNWYSWLPEEFTRLWEEIHIKIYPKLGLKFLKHLKKDTGAYFSTIQICFARALQKTFQYLFHGYVFDAQVLKYMLDDNFVPSYIVVSTVMPKHGSDEVNEILAPMHEKLKSHPSKQVQIHYNLEFGFCF